MINSENFGDLALRFNFFTSFEKNKVIRAN